MKLDLIAITLGEQERVRRELSADGVDGLIPIYGHDKIPDAENRLRATLDSITGDPYYVSPPITRDLATIAAEIPSHEAAFSTRMFPCTDGFVVLDGPVHGGWAVADEQGSAAYLRDLAWTCFDVEGTGRIAIMVTACLLLELRGRVAASAIAQCIIDVGDPLDAGKGVKDVLAPLYAVLKFLDQRILVASPMRRSARHEKIVHPWTPAPDVQIVTYRRTASHRRYGESEPHDWKFRFIQSGHWGRRLVGTKGDQHYEVVWVREGIKGPPNAPLRVSRKTLGAIIR